MTIGASFAKREMPNLAVVASDHQGTSMITDFELDAETAARIPAGRGGIEITLPGLGLVKGRIRTRRRLKSGAVRFYLVSSESE